jgi:predicted nucleic acid-binding protein
MAADPLCFFWDSCVFYAYLGDEREAYDVASIQQYLDETKRGLVRIYTSTLVLAEVVPSAIKRPEIGSFQDFLADFQGSIVLIEANPNIMHMASVMKDLPYRKGDSRKRRLGTVDAVMLASCLYQRDTIGVPIAEFHTFDDGKAKGLDGKAIPLLSYQEWCEGFDTAQRLSSRSVIELTRRRPAHPAPRLPLSPPLVVHVTAEGIQETPNPQERDGVPPGTPVSEQPQEAAPKEETDANSPPANDPPLAPVPNALPGQAAPTPPHNGSGAPVG